MKFAWKFQAVRADFPRNKNHFKFMGTTYPRGKRVYINNTNK